MQEDLYNQCRDYYQSIYQSAVQEPNNGKPAHALDFCLQHFLNQAPHSKKYSLKDKVKGLACTDVWTDSHAVAHSELASLALSKILLFDDAFPTHLAEILTIKNPDTLRWAIRYSGLFERQQSPTWLYLRNHCTAPAWLTFFGVCDRLIERLETFDQIIDNAEQELKSLSLLELLSYLSLLACSDLLEPNPSTINQRWKVYDRIIQRKLKSCSPKDFQLNEKTLEKSLKRHLSPLLFTSNSGWRDQCEKNLTHLTVLFSATSERIDYEGSINWFSFDPECHYQLEHGEPVIYNATEIGSKKWERSEQKSTLLWYYWLNRAIEAFIETDLAWQIIGKHENHEANQLAYIKAKRSQIQLKEIYGIEESITLENSTEVSLFHILIASELSSMFFDKAFIQPFLALRQSTTSTVEALGALALEGLLQGENRFPMTWSTESEKTARIKGWTASKEHPNGCLDAARGILNFWTSDLKTIAGPDETRSVSQIPRLTERPYCKIGPYSFQFPWVAGQQNNLTSVINNLRRLGARRSEAQAETRRIEQRLGDLLKQRGFKAVIGYHLPTYKGEDAGEVDLICHLDGTLLLLEVKSSYIRDSQREIWLHRTGALRKAAWQLQRKRTALTAALCHDQTLIAKLGCNSSPSIHCWIVDTSIELDGERIGGFPVVSREVLEVMLRDEQHLLRCTDQLELDQPRYCYANGFTAKQFVELIESEAIWQALE